MLGLGVIFMHKSLYNDTTAETYEVEKDKSRHFPRWTVVKEQTLQKPLSPTISDLELAIPGLSLLLLLLSLRSRPHHSVSMSRCSLSSLLLLSAEDQLCHSPRSLKTGWLRGKLRLACRPVPCRVRLSSLGQSTTEMIDVSGLAIECPWTANVLRGTNLETSCSGCCERETIWPALSCHRRLS